jgi:rhodanese-related sulfurtransferase
MPQSIEKQPASLSVFAIGLAILFGLLPLVLYWIVLGNVPTIDSAAALERLGNANSRVALIDVRPRPAYQERHIAGARSLPLTVILELDSAKDLPADLRNMTLLLVCDSGLLSAQATRHLSTQGVKAYNIRGGMQDWGRAWPQFKDMSSSRFELAGGVVQEPFREMSRGEQAAAALALLWIKPAYMLLSAVVSLYLILRTKTVDLRSLGWSLMVFLIGEVFCAVNYAFLKDNSYFAEYMHSYSMAIAFGLAAYALLEGLDQRLVHFSQADKHCALLPVCGQCAKYQPVRCRIHRIAQLMGVSLIFLAAIPLLAPFSYIAYNTQIGPIIHYYSRPIVHQWVEARFSPALAILLSGLALLIMQRIPHITLHPLARSFLCAAAGFLGFGMFRLMLGMVYTETLVWAIFWEELTELMFVATVMYLLWIFRRTVLPGVELLRDLIPGRLPIGRGG